MSVAASEKKIMWLNTVIKSIQKIKVVWHDES